MSCDRLFALCDMKGDSCFESIKIQLNDDIDFDFFIINFDVFFNRERYNEIC